MVMGWLVCMRKIVERVVVDGITGEVLDSQISFVKWQSERFLMMRTTYGVEFLMGLSKVELVLFFMLPVDIYCNPKMPIFNSLDDAVNVINSIKDGIKYHYFEV